MSEQRLIDANALLEEIERLETWIVNDYGYCLEDRITVERKQVEGLIEKAPTVKRLDNCEWVEGYYLKYKTKCYICPVICDVSYGDNGNRIRFGCWYVVDPETVCQYTGLKDKNGKKIWENDIVRAENFRFVVKYGKCGGVPNTTNFGYMGFYLGAADKETQKYINYGLRNDICHFDDIEVIGNAFDEVTE